MKLTRVYNALLICLCLFAVTTASAGVIFAFTEENGNVFMRASGSIDTSGLALSPFGTWTGTAVNSNNPFAADTIGTSLNNRISDVDIGFTFNIGSDLNPWFGDMFTADTSFNQVSGSTSFSNYSRDPTTGQIIAGLSVVEADLVGTIWTPSNVWSQIGTLSSLGLTEGDYTITDAVSGEFISIQIGQTTAVSAPGTASLFLLGLAGLYLRRGQNHVAYRLNEAIL